MQNFIMNIGSTVLNFFRNISGKALLDALEIMGIGYLGIFIVTGIIIGVVYLLSYFTRGK